MKSLRSAAMVAALLCSQANASSVMVSRQRQTAQIVNEIIKIFGEIFKGAKLAFPEKVNAWEYDKNVNLCEVYMETTNGGNCFSSVTCNDGKNEYKTNKETWNVCFKGGRQYFNDPRIGDFSITFTERDGVDGEGLTRPVLQVKDIGNWMEIPVTDLAFDKSQDDSCRDHNGLKCKDGPYVCTWFNNYDKHKGRTRRWKCGVPKSGHNFPGLDSNAPVNERGYRPGWCGVHVTHYQKPNPAKDSYSLEAKVFDANQNEVGNSGGKQGAKLVFGSKLPLPFVVSSGNVDKDPLYFEYDNVRWDSNDKSRCSVGAYDNGKREMDCGFICK